jgi:hypothetical protein
LDDIPDDVKRFISANISSVALLEVLLLMKNSPARQWSADDIGKQLYTSAETAVVQLEGLRSSRLLIVDSDGKLYQFAPHNTVDREMIERLDRLYHERRVTVTNLIYSAPVDTVRTFADAFKFRKDT